MKEFISILLLLILGWCVILTTQTTDLYKRYCEVVEKNEQLKIMIKEYRSDIEHELVIQEQTFDAIVKGIEREW